MKILLFILLISITSAFSQKLWEIQVNPDDLLRDVKEIPNSDLLLFTYNTGKLEIRRSGDGSLFKNVTTPQGELGSYSISGLGNSYYFSERGDYFIGSNETKSNDTIFVYDLNTDEIINRISFDIDIHKDYDNISKKKYRYNFTPDMTKIFGRIDYDYIQHVEGYSIKKYFFVYDIINKKVLFYEETNESYLSQGRFFLPDFHLDSYRSSPDSKYIILNGRDNGNGYNDEVQAGVKLFNVELNENSKLMNIENTSNDILGALSTSYKFINESKISHLHGAGFVLRSFPSLEVIYNINSVKDFGIYPSNDSPYYLCNNELFFVSGEKVPNGGSQDYRFWHLKINLNTNEVSYNSKNLYTFNTMFSSFVINNCSKIIISKDFDNRTGIIACYDYNTLDVETLNTSSSYFSNTGSSINFNSQEFIGHITRIEIYNITGNKVGMLYDGIINNPNYNFQLPELPSGAYYLQCNLPNNNLNFNFVVVR